MSNLKLDFENTVKPAERTFVLPNKLLITAGPTNCSPRVLSAYFQPTLSVVCSELFKIQDEMVELLKYLFQTKNQLTLAIQNSGTGGLEAVITNLIDPGEKILIAVAGIWGDRTILIAKTRNIDIIRVDVELGDVFKHEDLEKEIIKHKPVALFITHGETSTGALQPLDGLGEICHRHDCLLVVDVIGSLGATPVFVDRWGIDAAVGASQKAIGAPVGLAFLTFSERALKRMRSRTVPPPFYYDILEISVYWGTFGGPKRYFYTYNSNAFCATAEALKEVAEEGLINTWKRHTLASERFLKGAKDLGLEHFVSNPEHRLNCICCVKLPENLKWPMLIDYLEKNYQVVISFGVGPTKNKVLRFGFMGCNAKPVVVDYVLDALKNGLEYCRNNSDKEDIKASWVAL